MRDADDCEESSRDYAIPSRQPYRQPWRCQAPSEVELRVVCLHQWGARVGIPWIADARAETGLVGRCREKQGRKGANLLSERLSLSGMYYTSLYSWILSGLLSTITFTVVDHIHSFNLRPERVDHSVRGCFVKNTCLASAS